MTRSSTATTFLLGALFVGAVVLQFYKALHWGHSYWQMTEWLINYAGGFVRRGLPGASFFYLSAATGFPANALVLVASFLAFAGLTAIFAIRGKDRVPLYILLSPALLAAPAYGEFIVRKDILGVLLLAACIAIHNSTRPTAVKIVTINLAGVVATLSHEIFFFFAVPALTLMLCGGNWRRLPAAIGALAPVLAAFGFSVVFHGNAMIANAINGSWGDLWAQIDPRECCLGTPNAAIDALQWTTHQAISLSAGLLTKFSYGIYVPAAWLLTIVACFWFMVGFLEPKDGNRLAAILLFQLAMIAPLFVLGWDFGRWIFLWTASSLTLLLFDADAGFNFLARPATHLAATCRRFPPRPWYLLVFGIPPCCWATVTYAMSAPVGYPFRAAGLLP